MQKIVVLLLACTISSQTLGSPALSIASDDRLTYSSVSIDANSGMVRIVSKQQRLDKLLKKLGDVSGIDFLLIDPVQTEMTLDIGPVTIQQALRQLLRNNSYIVIQDNLKSRINRVLILPRGNESDFKPLVATGGQKQQHDVVKYINEIISSSPVPAMQPPPRQAQQLADAIGTAEFERMLETLPEIEGLHQAFEATREHWVKGLGAGYYRISPGAPGDNKAVSAFLGLPDSGIE